MARGGAGPVYGKTDEIVRAMATAVLYGPTRQGGAAGNRHSQVEAHRPTGELGSGHPADATGWTVARFLTVWPEQAIRPNRKPNTYITYEKDTHPPGTASGVPRLTSGTPQGTDGPRRSPMRRP